MDDTDTQKYTAEDLTRWIDEYRTHEEKGPQALATFFDAPKPMLQTRVNIFLHRFQEYGQRISTHHYDNVNQLCVRAIFVGWAAVLVGPDAPTGDVIPGGCAVLDAYISKGLRLW